MPYSILMQSWIRLRGSTGKNVVQDAEDWVDLSAFQGVSPYIDVAGNAGSPVISLETAPSRDEALFAPLQNTRMDSVFNVSTTGVQAVTAFSFENAAAGSAPPGRWLRWNVTGGANWRIVFRIWLNLLQGRGGSFKHATIPLPPEAHRHPEDHAHRVQPMLAELAASRARAAQEARGGHASAPRTRAPVGPGTAIYDALIDPKGFVASVARLGGPHAANIVQAHVQRWTELYEPAREDVKWHLR